MREHLQEEGVIQFLLKSFVDGDWRFNVPVLWDQYPHIVGWETIPAWPHPTQFIPGGNSPYVTDAYRDALLAQFPQAGPRHRRRRTLGPCRETRGGVTRHPPLSDEHRRLIG
ncbi:Esterase ybfF [Klebsiella pneumoniae]|uniref:Esterase ybfF n=1 Tax=Klebsiella pneumoniae TaxID=573 RepID=A0A2X3EPR3_KLEPN|nr:Esterase ybfF [Klebsiella pneumoniae]